MKKIIRLAVLSVPVLLAACQTDNTLNTSYSNTTGWKYNDKKSTKFEVVAGYEGNTPVGMVPIQGGTFMVGERGEFVTAPRNNQQRNITVSSFYMDKYEVSNLNWREYLNWTKVVFGHAAPQLVKQATPDLTVWREELAYNEPYLENYFEHPAFNFYPVVGVTWEQAMDFCTWRTDRVNELALIKAGIIEAPDFTTIQVTETEEGTGEEYAEAAPEEVAPEEGGGEEDMTSLAYIRKQFVFNTQKYLLDKTYNPTEGKSPKIDFNGEVRKINTADGILCVGYRLPTEAEWEFAAYAPIANSEGLSIEGKIYPWSGYQPRNLTKTQQGQLQANFVRGRGDMMGVSGALNDGYVITGPVNAYAPNDFGLYNMAGNVNEWVLDVFRETSNQETSEYNTFRGNMYMAPIESVDENGRKSYAIDSLGRIRMEVKVREDDVRDYKDGDIPSTIKTDYPLYEPDSVTISYMGITTVKKDPTDILAPKVSNKTRVYKGGSWRDRIYWLNPATRRYLDQDQCSNTIGFRCAMSTVGTQVKGHTAEE